MRLKILLLFFGISTYVYSQIPYTNLQGFYPFNGNALDESGNSRDGEVHGAVLSSDRFNVDSSAYSFDGISNYIALPSSFDYPERTISLWFKAGAMKETSERLYYSDNPALHYSSTTIDLQYDALSGITRLRFACGGSVGNSIYDTIQLNTWYHAVITIDTNIVRAYVNGQLLDTAKYVDHPAIDGDTNAFLGVNRTRQQYFFNGLIDDVRIYNKVLSQRDILFLYYESPRFREIQVNDTIPVFDTMQINDTIRVFDTIQVNDTIPVFDSVAVTDTLIINVPLSIINSHESNIIKVYPNPTKDVIFIDNGDYSQMAGYRIRIMDLNSKYFYETAIDRKIISINISDMRAKGIYLIQILDDQSRVIDTRKILLE